MFLLYLLLPLLSSSILQPHVTSDRVHLSRLTPEKRDPNETRHREHLSLADAIVLNVSICNLFFPKRTLGDKEEERGLSIFLVDDSPY